VRSAPLFRHIAVGSGPRALPLKPLHVQPARATFY
jgi:hypothetical protein